MLDIDTNITPTELLPAISGLWTLAANKVSAVDASYRDRDGAPVFTVDGIYSSQGWTEWTQGFQFGSAAILFDATKKDEFLEIARRSTFDSMTSHVTHFGVHDHGFNNVSTYGNLRRMMLEGTIKRDDNELRFYEMAVCASSSVQSNRWTKTADGDGFIYSFNGPHSLFCDTIRSLRVLSLGHKLGHSMMGENDQRTSLLDRMLQHARSTARYNVYYGEQRDIYDVPGRVAHESIFNVNDGQYRCPSTQQGYSPFTTWTRGLAWVMLGYPEQLEYLASLKEDDLREYGGLKQNHDVMLRAAIAACDFFIENTCPDGIPYWDTGAPGLVHLKDHQQQHSDPFNEYEPVDSSAAAIGAQGLLRLGHFLSNSGGDGSKYWQAGLTVLRTLLASPYLSTEPQHQGILLHSVYHRPRGWDRSGPNGVPNGESSMWGDYHLLEAALYVQRVANQEPYYTFFGPADT